MGAVPVTDATGTDVLLIGGRSGVGKTTVGYEVSAQLQAAAVAHCLIDGDNLDAAYPKPADDPHGTRLTEANLAALWRTYAALGHRRAVYVNTASVLEPELVVRGVGGVATVVAILLTAADDTVQPRLANREIGSGLQLHLDRSARVAAVLDARSPAGTHRVPTDGRSVTDIAADIVAITGWR